MTVQHHQHSPSGRDDDRDSNHGLADPTARYDDSKEPADDPSQVAVRRVVESLSRNVESKYPPAVPPEEATTIRFPVEDGNVIARLDDTELSDAAADALWRIIEKSTRRKRSR